MKEMFVYILKCSDNSYYTGVTNNVERRVIEHQEGIDNKSYTYNRRPIELVFYQSYTDASNAIMFEKKLKGWSRAKKEALINNNLHLLPELSMNNKKKKLSV